MARILVVDDEQEVLDTVGLVLRHEKHTVLTALDGATAIDIITREEVDVVMVDIRMSPMHGLEVIARTRELNPRIEVIVISAYKDDDVIRKAMQMGCAKFVEKPLTLKKILGPIRAILARRDKAEARREASGEAGVDDMGWVF